MMNILKFSSIIMKSWNTNCFLRISILQVYLESYYEHFTVLFRNYEIMKHLFLRKFQFTSIFSVNKWKEWREGNPHYQTTKHVYSCINIDVLDHEVGFYWEKSANLFSRKLLTTTAVSWEVSVPNIV